MFDGVLDEHDGVDVERQQVVGDFVDPIVSVEQVHRRDADSLRSLGDGRLIGDEEDRPCEHQTAHPDQDSRERDPTRRHASATAARGAIASARYGVNDWAMAMVRNPARPIAWVAITTPAAPTQSHPISSTSRSPPARTTEGYGCAMPYNRSRRGIRTRRRSPIGRGTAFRSPSVRVRVSPSAHSVR